MKWIDFHTHQYEENADVISIRNFAQQFFVEAANLDGYGSAGLHPYWLDESVLEMQMTQLTMLSQQPNMLLIGECGLDKTIEIPLDFQKEVFERQVLLAETVGKPVVIHCVKAFNEVIALKKKLNPAVPWVIHGFNNNANVLKTLIDNDLYISIGGALLRSNSNASKWIRHVPMERLFLETDAKPIPIKTVYAFAAEQLNISQTHLRQQIYQNFLTIRNVAAEVREMMFAENEDLAYL
jgi:TatD DNase family protein